MTWLSHPKLRCGKALPCSGHGALCLVLYISPSPLPSQYPSVTVHIVPCGKFHRIGGAPPETFPSENYDAPEEVGGDRKCFDSPIRK